MPAQPFDGRAQIPMFGGVARGFEHWCWAGVLLLAGCGDKERPGGGDAGNAGNGAAAGAGGRAWRTVAWPMARGGPALQGRVGDPVPPAPRVEWTFGMKGGIVAQAALDGDLAVVGDDEGVVQALDLAARRPRWTFTAQGAIGAAPAIASGRVFVGSEAGTFHALDLRSGAELWHLEADNKFATGAVVVASPGGDDEWVLVNNYEGITRCLRSADGSVVWTYQTGDFLNGSPAVIDGGLVAFGGCDAVVHAVRLADGARAGALETEAPIIDSVATMGGTIYCCNHADQVVAAAAGADRPEWVYQADGNAFLTAPGVDDERVYAGARDGQLHAIVRRSGAGAWRFKAGGGVTGAPLVFDDAVVCGAADGRLYAVGKADGRELWQLELGEELAAAPAFAGGRIVVGGGEGTLFVVR